MNENKLSVVELLKMRMNKYIVEYGMYNGYETSFGDTIISKDVYSARIRLKTISDAITIGELHNLGYELYKDLHRICLNNLKEFEDTEVRIFSKHTEHGCYRHYISFIQTVQI